MAVAGLRRPRVPSGRALPPTTQRGGATTLRAASGAQGIGATTTSAGCTSRRTTTSSSTSAICSTTIVSATGPQGRLWRRARTVSLGLTATACGPVSSTRRAILRYVGRKAHCSSLLELHLCKVRLEQSMHIQ
eukprot:8015562-Pyramimonas_sp.AAC.1